MGRNQITSIGKKVRTLTGRGTLALFLASALTACDSGTGPELAHVKIQLTDEPTDIMESVEVWISHVYLQGGGGEEPDTAASDSTDTGGGRVDLFNDPENPFYVDLLTLQDSTITDLTSEIPVDVGTYQSLRFVVDSALVTLVEGVTFEDGSSTATLYVPSGSTSGVKVKLKDVIDADADETTTVLVDFDVNASFVVQGSHGPGGIRKIIMKPVLKELHRETEQN